MAGLVILMFMAVALFGWVFLLLRVRHRMRVRKGHPGGFYPSTVALGNALHTLQGMAVPQIQHVMQKKLAEPAEDAANGEDTKGFVPVVPTPNLAP